MSSKILLRIFVNTLIGGVLIYFWFKLVDIKAVIEALSNVSLWILPSLVICFLLASFLRAVRFKILLSGFHIPVKNLWFLTMLSQLLSFTIPIRAGEITKGVYLSTNYSLPFAKSIVWVLLDRFIDFWFSVVIALLLILFIPTSLPSNFKPLLTLTVISLTAATALLLFTPSFTKKLLELLSHLLIFGKLKKLFISFTHFLIDSAVFLRKDAKDSGKIILLTVLALIAEALSWYFGFLAVTGQSLDLLTIQLGSVLTALTYLIPAAPGYVGSAEASGLAVFGYGLGFDKTLVSATTVLTHALTLLYMLISGLIALYLLKFDLNLVWKKFKK